MKTCKAYFSEFSQFCWYLLVKIVPGTVIIPGTDSTQVQVLSRRNIPQNTRHHSRGVCIPPDQHNVDDLAPLLGGELPKPHGFDELRIETLQSDIGENTHENYCPRICAIIKFFEAECPKYSEVVVDEVTVQERSKPLCHFYPQERHALVYTGLNHKFVSQATCGPIPFNFYRQLHAWDIGESNVMVWFWTVAMWNCMVHPALTAPLCFHKLTLDTEDTWY